MNPEPSTNSLSPENAEWASQLNAQALQQVYDHQLATEMNEKTKREAHDQQWLKRLADLEQMDKDEESEDETMWPQLTVIVEETNQQVLDQQDDYNQLPPADCHNKKRCH